MKLNVGILGGGNISRTHLRAARESGLCEVTAVCGRDLDKIRELSESADATAYQDLSSFLAHRPMEAVFIGSPSGLHAEQGIAAARKGLHVLTEKPVDITTERVDRLIQVCDEQSVQLGVFLQDRVSKDLGVLKRLLDSGELGRPILVSAHVRWYRDPEYFGDSNWRGTWALDGGGALMNQGVHTVDLLLWLLGDVSRVFARAETLLHPIEVEDTVVATLEFANGTLGTLEAATSAYPGYPRRVVLTTDRGTVSVEQDRIVKVDLREPLEELNLSGEGDRNPSSTSAVVSDISGHRRIIEDFVQSIREGRPPLCDGRNGRRSVELVQAVYESSRSGKPVRLGDGAGDVSNPTGAGFPG